MPLLDVGFTDNGLVVLIITEQSTGQVLQVPLIAKDARTLGANLQRAADRVRRPVVSIATQAKRADGLILRPEFGGQS